MKGSLDVETMCFDAGQEDLLVTFRLHIIDLLPVSLYVQEQ
jgi:hypothetical protein